mmetsp:Transcript_20094/g.43620  ORF Transcript_20094/g.43620 Transcript_20094/m.43620 type:complete len:220 (-) Transcript_20094:521-1180(-)
MADRPHQDSTPNPTTIVRGKFRDIDHDDPYDKAFLLVTKWGVPPQAAIDSTGAIESVRALERRAIRWFERFDPPVANANTPPSTTTTPLTENPDATTTPTDNPNPSPSAATTTPTNNSSPPSGKKSSLTKARDAALDILPDWMSKSKTENAMLKRKKRTTLEMNRDNFDKNAVESYYDNRYKKVWKEATTEYYNILGDESTRGKHGFGSMAVGIQQWSF